MNRAGSVESRILGMGGGVQVGLVPFGTIRRAVTWRGTPQSAVVLETAGAIATQLNATTGMLHAGTIRRTGSAEATLWLGDNAEDYVNSHAYLPPEFWVSDARGVSVPGRTIYVCGHGNRPGEREQALLWIGRLPERAGPNACPQTGGVTDANGDCLVDLADLTALLSAFGTTAGTPGWNADLDFDPD